MNGHYDRMRLISSMEEGVGDVILEEHERLLEYVSQKDVDGAVKLLQMHIRVIQLYQEDMREKWKDYFFEK